MTDKISGHYLLLYGSQTGQSQAIAEDIFERSPKYGLHPELHCLSGTGKKFDIEKEQYVVIVTSSTGDGDPPDTAIKFVRRLCKKTLPSDFLSKVNYSVLGLGDSNYSNFNGNPKKIDQRLSQLGAQRFHPSAFADEVEGLETTVDPWIEGLFAALQKFLGVGSASDTHAASTIHESDTPQSSCNGVHDPQSPVADDSSPAASENQKNETLDSSEHSRTADGSQSLIPNKSETDGSELLSTLHLDSSQVCQDGDLEKARNEVSGELPVSVNSKGPDQYPINKSDNSHTVNLNRDLSVDAQNSMKIDEKNELTQKNGREETFLQLSSPVFVAPSLRVSVPPLSESNLTLPAATPAFLTVQYLPPDQDLPKKLAELPWQNNCKPPSAASEIIKARVVSAERLTAEDALKKTLLLKLNVENSGRKYRPGDSISIICTNDDREVNQVITRLGLNSVADLPLKLDIMPDTKKRRAAVPPNIPEEGASLRYILKNCLDIREPPKKALLRLLVDCTSDDSEKRRLQELCSKEGAEDYSTFIRAENVSLLDVLYTFMSCQPPVERLIEHLPRLQPRPYSICSCEEWQPGHIDIAFNVVEVPTSQCRLYARRGLCTGWLDDITQSLQHGGPDKNGGEDLGSLMSDMEQVSLRDIEISMVYRTNQHFRPPADLTVPLIMIGPGTGVAPYVGFLQERQLRMEKEENRNVGETWLLFGCRHEKKDFLFRSAIQDFQEKGVLTKFLPAFSRDVHDSPDSPRYVQDNIQAFSAEIFSLIHQKQAIVFVCGDAKNMAKDVGASFEQIVMQEQGVSAEDAKTYVMKMRVHRQYLEDVWT